MIDAAVWNTENQGKTFVQIEQKTYNVLPSKITIHTMESEVVYFKDAVNYHPFFYFKKYEDFIKEYTCEN